MKRFGLVLVMCLARLGFATEPNALQRLQARVHVELVSPLTRANLAGKYSSPTKEFSPGLSGDDLYLFPDGTYIYDEWADVQPLTIYDRGKWRVDDGSVVLRSDKEVTWDSDEEHTYIAVTRQSHTDEILLIGMGTALARFEEDQDVQPETALMIFAKERRMAIKNSEDRRENQEEAHFYRLESSLFRKEVSTGPTSLHQLGYYVFSCTYRGEVVPWFL